MSVPTTMTAEELTVRALFAALDAGDIARVLRLFTEDVRFQFGNAEPTLGPDAFAASAANLQAVVAGLSHELAVIWTVQEPDRAVICEMAVTYERHDGSRLTLPCLNVFRLRQGLIADYRVYMDMNPLLSP
jgi:ketosteroid isomerase-like protein